MPTFRKSSVFAECDRCGASFDPVYGGVCDACRRVLCTRHFYGSLLRRVLVYLGAGQRCVACRQRPDSTAGPAGT